MKIRKKEQSVGVLGKVLNALSKSNKDTYSANYLNERLVKVSPTEPETGEEVWIQRGKNLVNGFRNNQSFNVGTNSYQDDPYGFSVTDYIPVKAGKTYIFSHHLNHWCGGVHLFDKNYIFLQTINADKMYDPIVISNMNCKYVIIYTWDPNNNTLANETWMQLEEGTEVTEYEPYIEKKVYLKNDDGNYEEFINKKNMGELIVDDIKCKNLFNPITAMGNSNGVVKSYNENTGEFTFNGTTTKDTYIGLSQNITLEAGKTYTLSTNIVLPNNTRIYANKYANIGVTYADTSIAPGNKKITFIAKQTGFLNFAMVIPNGTTVDFKITVQLEENNKATEFIKFSDIVNEDFYSVTEQKIGTWIDGNTLYRKCISGTLPSKTNQWVMEELNISDLRYVVKSDFYFDNASDQRYKAPFYESDSYKVLYTISDIEHAASTGGALHIFQNGFGGNPYRVDLYYTKNSN